MLLSLFLEPYHHTESSISSFKINYINYLQFDTHTIGYTIPVEGHVPPSGQRPRSDGEPPPDDHTIRTNCWILTPTSSLK